MNVVAQKAQELVTPIIENIGYEVVDIDYSKSYGENNLTIYIFKKGGVTLDDCEKVNNALDEVLDNNDITDGVAYNLNISSPGLDRPIVTKDDFRRNLDTEIEVLFIEPVGKKKKTNGILVAYDDDTVTLRSKDKDVVIDRKNASQIRPYIKF